MNIHIIASTILIGIMLLFPVYLYRACKGPSLYDRLIGLNGIMSKAILFLAFLGIYDRVPDMLIDISLGYALLNLVGGLAVAKYLEARGIQDS